MSEIECDAPAWFAPVMFCLLLAVVAMAAFTLKRTQEDVTSLQSRVSALESAP